MDRTTYGLDLAKSVMHLYWVDHETGAIGSRSLKRGQLLGFLARRAPGVVVMEACGGAHHWARQIAMLGHRVRLLHARHVRPYVRGNKNDSADAAALWSAAHDPRLRDVPIKAQAQQAVLALHRARAQWVKVRTQTVNALRGLLYEFGVVLPGGRQAGLGAIQRERARLEAQLPEAMRILLDGQLAMLRGIDVRIDELEAQIEALARQSPTARALDAIPGVGPLGASALAALLGERGEGYADAREFAACLGLVPGHSGTGGRVQIGSITKRGDPYVRTLLIHGARAVIEHGKTRPAWLEQLLGRRPKNVATVALANKIARTAWAMVARGRAWQPDYAAA